jgi:putative Holliday junction resolvase
VGQSYLGRVAALDLGEAYAGIALSDLGGTLASPLEVVSADLLNEYLRDLFDSGDRSRGRRRGAEDYGWRGRFPGPRVLDTFETLREEFPAIHFVPWDERLTTKVARSAVGGGPKRGKRRRARERVDHLAAAAMLQEYLDMRRALEAAR